MLFYKKKLISNKYQNIDLILQNAQSKHKYYWQKNLWFKWWMKSKSVSMNPESTMGPFVSDFFP